MTFKGRALYNLLRFSPQEEKNVQVKPWQVLDYRLAKEEELFKSLEELGVVVGKQMFLLYAESQESPEDLLDFLWIDEEDSLGQERAYLVIFELWRRLVPAKKSLSVFCDELDHAIAGYDGNEKGVDERVSLLLDELENIVDEAVDHGADVGEILPMISEHSAHDIEPFLYDYISDQIVLGNEVYASELLDGFYSYVADRAWFDFLRARLFALSDPKEGDILLLRLLELLEEEPDLQLLLEICGFLINRGDLSLFRRAAHIALTFIENEEDFQDLLFSVADFYRFLDQDAKELQVRAMIKNRENHDREASISSTDKQVVKDLLS